MVTFLEVFCFVNFNRMKHMYMYMIAYHISCLLECKNLEIFRYSVVYHIGKNNDSVEYMILLSNCQVISTFKKLRWFVTENLFSNLIFPSKKSPEQSLLCTGTRRYRFYSHTYLTIQIHVLLVLLGRGCIFSLRERCLCYFGLLIWFLFLIGRKKQRF